MTYTFTNTPEEAIARFWDNLAYAHEGPPNADPGLRRALIALVELDDRLAQIGPLDAETLRQFRQESQAALLDFDTQIAIYCDIAIFLAEGANDDEWYELCMRRSVLQVLLDDYTGTPLAALINPGDVAELDEELRRVGAEQGPVPAPFVPNGLPASHWWWHYPSLSATADTA